MGEEREREKRKREREERSPLAVAFSFSERKFVMKCPEGEREEREGE